MNMIKMVQNAAREAEYVKIQLETLQRFNNEDASREATEALFKRCNVLAAHSQKTVTQIIDYVGTKVMSTGASLGGVLKKLEAEYKVPREDAGYQKYGEALE